MPHLRYRSKYFAHAIIHAFIFISTHTAVVVLQGNRDLKKKHNVQSHCRHAIQPPGEPAQNTHANMQ